MRFATSCEPVQVRVHYEVIRELARYKLDLVDVQEVRCDKWGTVRVGYYIFSMLKDTKIINWEQVLSKPQNNINS